MEPFKNEFSHAKARRIGEALKRAHPGFTAEFAIRPFLREHPQRTLKQLRAWCGDPDKHVRRLVSEGIHHRKANGSLSPKVFKGRVRELTPGELWEITGRHSFKLVTTRVYHPGIHRFEPRINGKAFPAREFVLG